MSAGEAKPIDYEPKPPPRPRVRDDTAYVLPMAAFLLFTWLATSGLLNGIVPQPYAVSYVVKTVVVAAMLWAREAKRVATPADLPPGWLSALEGVRLLADEPRLDLAALAESDGVVTGCALAIAETGTVVLDGGRAQGRRELTLVPGHHLCVVHADQIVGSVPEAVDRVDPYRPLTWISGPSGGRALEILYPVGFLAQVVVGLLAVVMLHRVSRAGWMEALAPSARTA